MIERGGGRGVLAQQCGEASRQEGRADAGVAGGWVVDHHRFQNEDPCSSRSTNSSALGCRVRRPDRMPCPSIRRPPAWRRSRGSAAGAAQVTWAKTGTDMAAFSLHGRPVASLTGLCRGTTGRWAPRRPGTRLRGARGRGPSWCRPAGLRPATPSRRPPAETADDGRSGWGKKKCGRPGRQRPRLIDRLSRTRPADDQKRWKPRNPAPNHVCDSPFSGTQSAHEKRVLPGKDPKSTLIWFNDSSLTALSVAGSLPLTKSPSSFW